MIYVRLYGGLGNQMFQYAAGKALAVKNRTDLTLDTSSLSALAGKKYHTASLSTYRLDAFRIQAYTTTELPAAERVNHYPEKYRELLCRYDKDVLEQGDETCLDGHYWQSERYFSKIAAAIREDFRLQAPLGETAAALERRIQATLTSVGMHVRRGDYVENDFFSKMIGAQEPAYYHRAIEALRERLAAPFTLYVFSDEIDWVRATLELDQYDFPVEYVSRPGVRAVEDQYLLSRCHHQIIPNSSFSWWAAWLNPNPDKRVIAPRQWIAVNILNNPDQIPEQWTQI